VDDITTQLGGFGAIRGDGSVGGGLTEQPSSAFSYFSEPPVIAAPGVTATSVCLCYVSVRGCVGCVCTLNKLVFR